MAEEKKSLLKIISEKRVKPFSPTPPSSRYYKFSALDVEMLDLFLPFVFCYKKESLHDSEKYLGETHQEQLFDMLETSLSKTLMYYYPFAGTFMDDNITVDCNDVGVQVWRVEIQAPMSKILNNHSQYHPWNAVILPEMYSSLKSHAKIQLNHFECNGICVVVSLSHKLAEGLVTCKFVNDWAKLAREKFIPSSPTMLSAASIFPPPPPNQIRTPKLTNSLLENSPFVSQRFVFSSSSISKLKEIVTKETEIQNPSKTEVVTILIYKSIISAAAKKIKSNSKGCSKPSSSLIQTANIRQLTIPPISDQYLGNFLSRFVITNAAIEHEEENEETKFSSLVTELRKSKLEFQNRHKIYLDDGNHEFMEEYSRFWDESENKLIGDKYTFTSLIRFPFYEADFGFGKPVFVFTGSGLLAEVIGLVETAIGIEAFVTLEKEKMSFLERDKEFLAYASVNPQICFS